MPKVCKPTSAPVDWLRQEISALVVFYSMAAVDADCPDVLKMVYRNVALRLNEALETTDGYYHSKEEKKDAVRRAKGVLRPDGYRRTRAKSKAKTPGALTGANDNIRGGTPCVPDIE